MIELLVYPIILRPPKLFVEHVSRSSFQNPTRSKVLSYFGVDNVTNADWVSRLPCSYDLFKVAKKITGSEIGFSDGVGIYPEQKPVKYIVEVFAQLYFKNTRKKEIHKTDLGAHVGWENQSRRSILL